MNDRSLSLLEQYEVEVIRTRKGRGAILCDTDQGCLIFKEYAGSAEKLSVQDRLLAQIARMGKVRVEKIIPTRDGMLSVKDNDGASYILKSYFEGRECNIYDRSECVEAVKVLAQLHTCMELPEEDAGAFPVFSPEKEYEKHNRELRKVRRYLRQKGQKSWFEICLQNSFDYFLEQALDVTRDWTAYSQAAPFNDGSISAYCHGDYQYHNIVKYNGEWCIINFEKCMRDNPVRDLYLLLRKLLEKGGWNIALGTELLTAYEAVMPISAYSRIDLYYRLAYPEKFWKIVNFYFNSGKAWIPERNQEKLEKLIGQEEAKQRFLEVVFREV